MEGQIIVCCVGSPHCCSLARLRLMSHICRPPCRLCVEMFHVPAAWVSSRAELHENGWEKTGKGYRVGYPNTILSIGRETLHVGMIHVD
jgi:hypothetical protein